MDKVHEGISELEFSPQDIPDHAVKIAALLAVELTESILPAARGPPRCLTPGDREAATEAAGEGRKGCTKMNLTMHLKKRF